MRARRARARRSALPGDGAVLPLVNVVLLLLIAFLAAGRLSAPEPFEVTPPDAASGGPAEGAALRVHLAADGRLALDGAAMERADLLAGLSARLGDAPGRDIALTADARAPAAALSALLADLAGAGAREVRLTTLRAP